MIPKHPKKPPVTNPQELVIIRRNKKRLAIANILFLCVATLAIIIMFALTVSPIFLISSYFALTIATALFCYELVRYKTYKFPECKKGIARKNEINQAKRIHALANLAFYGALIATIFMLVFNVQLGLVIAVSILAITAAMPTYVYMRRIDDFIMFYSSTKFRPSTRLSIKLQLAGLLLFTSGQLLLTLVCAWEGINLFAGIAGITTASNLLLAPFSYFIVPAIYFVITISIILEAIGQYKYIQDTKTKPDYTPLIQSLIKVALNLTLLTLSTLCSIAIAYPLAFGSIALPWLPWLGVVTAASGATLATGLFIPLAALVVLVATSYYLYKAFRPSYDASEPTPTNVTQTTTNDNSLPNQSIPEIFPEGPENKEETSIKTPSAKFHKERKAYIAAILHPKYDSDTSEFPFTYVPNPLESTKYTIEFSYVSSNKSDSYLWNFGDGSPKESSELPNPIHTYKKPGEYTVQLTVTTGNKVSTLEQKIQIVDPDKFPASEQKEQLHNEGEEHPK